ncbi:unnamed protein product [Soboliphyme baturini]|uniref:Neprilysin n=1 Tax=Soboliphyme baturini TaxID=241478 RepID=A0A183II45_9BILA|nr:unnamed protein product [Soboliphyme baturini]
MAYEAYRKCLDTATLNEVKSKHIIEIIRKVGGWPMLHGNWSKDSFDLTELLGKIRRDYSLDIFFTLYVYADAKNTTANILSIHQGSLGLGASMRDYYLNDTLYGKVIEAYEKYMITIGKLIAEDEGIPVNNSFYDEVQKLIQFERNYALIISPDEQRRNHTLMYNRRSVQQLKKNMPLIKWDQFFNYILPEVVREKFYDEETDVIVSDPEYLAKISMFLEITDKNRFSAVNRTRLLTNYVIWRLIKSFTSLLDERFDDAFQDLMYIMAGRQARPSRWKVCVPTIVSWFEMATGALYVDAYFRQKDKDEALAMIANLREAFVRIVNAIDWMDNQTKHVAIVKAEAMLNHIGYPEFLNNMTALDEYYENIDITSDDGYFEMGLKVLMWIQEQEFLDLLKPFNRNRFDTSPAVVNAFYSPEKNAIGKLNSAEKFRQFGHESHMDFLAFPAGILQPPFFSGDNLKAINYGAMGAVIGHEITHGFDDQGSQYDKDGNLKDWWTAEALERFRERTKCIIEQYNNYTVPEIGINVNGRLTQGENIADNAGAYRKYISDRGSEEPRLPGLSHITNDQIFFLSYANFWCGSKKPAAALQQVLTDPHSPEIFRVIGVMSNLDEFAIAFDCKPGTFMNPDSKTRRKCSVW